MFREPFDLFDLIVGQSSAVLLVWTFKDAFLGKKADFLDPC